jgi:hypothetical protein
MYLFHPLEGKKTSINVYFLAEKEFLMGGNRIHRGRKPGFLFCFFENCHFAYNIQGTLT